MVEQNIYQDFEDESKVPSKRNIYQDFEEESKEPSGLRSRQDPRPIAQQTTVDPKSGEEVPAVAAPTRTMKSLDTNPEWLKAAKAIYKYEEGKEALKTDKDLSRWLKNRQAKFSWDIYNTGTTAKDVKNFTPEVKDAWLNSLNLYEEADPNLRSAWNAFRQMITDPVGVGIGIGTGGIGWLGTKVIGKAAAIAARASFQKQLIKSLVSRGVQEKVATKFAEKKIIDKTITSGILADARKEAAKSAMLWKGRRAMLPGALYMGAYDFAQQSFDAEMEFIDSETGELKEVDPIGVATAALEGAVTLGLMGRYGGRASEKLFRHRRVRQHQEKLNALEAATVKQSKRTAGVIAENMESSAIEMLAFETQRDLVKNGKINLNIKGTRAKTDKAKNAKGTSKVVQSRASLEEIKNAFRSRGIEIEPVRGSRGQYIGRKINEFNIGPKTGEVFGADLGRGELTVGWLKRKVSSDAGLPREAGRLIREQEAGVRRAQKHAKVRIGQLDKAAKKEFDVKKVIDLPEKTLYDLNQVLKGNAATVNRMINKYTKAPKTLKVLQEMRKDLQFYQSKLLESGAIKPEFYTKGAKKGQLKEGSLYGKIEKSMDGTTSELWINRQYKIFDDPAWKEIAFATPDIYIGARSWVKGKAFEKDKRLLNIDNKLSNHIITDASGVSNYNYKGAAQAGISPNDLAYHKQYFDSDTGYITKLMDDIMNIHGEEEMFKLFGSGKEGLKIGKNPLTILKGRQNIPAPVRRLMGEYEDPFTNFENSFLKLNSTIETYSYEKGISDLVKGGYIPGAGPIRSKTRAETTELKSRLPERAGVDIPYEAGGEAGLQRPLSGLYGRGAVADAILNGNEILHQTAAAGKAGGNYIGGKVVRGYLFQQGLTRGAKVLYSLTAYPRNFLSAGMMAFGAGYFRPQHLRALKPVFKEMIGWSDGALRTEIEKMITLGTHQSGVHLAGIRANFADAASGSLFTQLSPIYRSQRSMAARAKRFNLKVAEVYQGLDDMWKFFGFLNEKSNYRNVLIGRASLAKIKQAGGEALNIEERKLLGAWNKQGGKFYDPSLDIIARHRSADGLEYSLTYLDRVAADQTLRHMQNYASVSQFIKYLRTMPFADFFSYTSELARTQYNILKTAKNEVREGRELMRRDIRLPDGTLAGEQIASNGLYRLGSTIIAQSSAGAASAYSAEKVYSNAKGLAADTFEYIQSFGRDFEKGNYYYWLTEPKNGKGRRINLSYVFPWATYHSAINETIQGIQTGGEDVDHRIGQAVWDGTMGTLHDWFGPSMWASAVANVWMGYDEYGREIRKEGVENLGWNTVQAMKEMWKAYSPGGEAAVMNIIRSYTDRPDVNIYEAIESGLDPKKAMAAIRRGKSGARFNTQDQWIALSGIKPEEYDISIQMGYDIAKTKRKMSDANKIFTNMVQEKSPTTIDDLEEAYAETLAKQFSTAKDLNDIFERARGAGLDNEAIRKSLTSQGLYKLDKQMWDSLLKTGRYVPPKPRSSQIMKWFRETKLEVGAGPPIHDAQERLMKIYHLYRNAPTISEEPNIYEQFENE